MEKVINESVIRKLVIESIKNIINELSIPNMGSMGPFKGESTAKLLSDIPNDILSKLDDGSRSLPDFRSNKNEFMRIFGNTISYKIYLQYKSAIESNPNMKAINYYLFLSRLKNGFHGLPMAYFEDNGSYLLGALSMGQFLVAYFAPLGKMGIFNSLKEICQYDNIVISVPDNLASMLQRLGLPELNDKVHCKFRGQNCDKHIFGSTMQAAEKGSKIISMTTLDTKKLLNGDKATIDFLLQNPDIVEELMKMPSVQNAVKGNALNLVSLIMKNPQLLQKNGSTI